MGYIIGLFLFALALDMGTDPPVITQYEIRHENLPDALVGKSAIIITDTHIGSIIGLDWLNDRVDQIQARQPDIIFLVGDVFEGREDIEGDPVPTLNRLKAPLGVWAVTGNHEFYGQDNKSIAYLEQSEVKLLRNECVSVADGFSLAGVDDLTIARWNGKSDSAVSETLSECSDPFIILLSHSPLAYELAAETGAELMISGHTHGGQIWPLDYLVRLMYPLLEGEYKINDMTVIVSRGAGTWGPRMRLWEPGEIVQIKLVKP